MLQAGIRRAAPRAATLTTARVPLASQAVRSYSRANQLQHHNEGRREVGNRRDWNDDFTNWNWLSRWDPFADFGKLGGMREFENNMPSVSTWRPRSSITETKDGDVLITAEMPGLAKEDIQVELKNGVLTIQGSKKEEKKDEANGSHYKQKRSFHRSFSVPEDIDPTLIKAKMEHGVLEVTIPKPKEVEQKSTAITIE